MKRLPSTPDYIRKKEIDEWVRRSRRRRLLVDISILMISLICVSFLWFFNSGFWNNFKDRTDGLDCKIGFVDMNNGYSVLLECEGKTALLDYGNKDHSDEIVQYLKTNKIEELDYYFVLDATEEYKSVCKTVLNSVGIQSLVLPSDEDRNGLISDYDEMAFMNGKTATFLKAGRTFNVHRILVEIIDSHSSSFKISFGNHSFIIWNSGDENKELYAVESFYGQTVDVLWIGKNANQSKKIFESLTPQYCIVDSENENYDMDFIKQYSEGIYVTGNGEKIIVSSNEVDIDIETENQ